MIKSLTVSDFMATNVLGRTVIGVDNCHPDYEGTIEKVTQINHSVLGNLVQVWVKWSNQSEHLTPYFPKQFRLYSEKNGCGVYLA